MRSAEGAQSGRWQTAGLGLLEGEWSRRHGTSGRSDASEAGWSRARARDGERGRCRMGARSSRQGPGRRRGRTPGKGGVDGQVGQQVRQQVLRAPVLSLYLPQAQVHPAAPAGASHRRTENAPGGCTQRRHPLLRSIHSSPHRHVPKTCLSFRTPAPPRPTQHHAAFVRERIRIVCSVYAATTTSSNTTIAHMYSGSVRLSFCTLNASRHPANPAAIPNRAICWVRPQARAPAIAIASVPPGFRQLLVPAAYAPKTARPSRAPAAPTRTPTPTPQTPRCPPPSSGSPRTTGAGPPASPQSTPVRPST